VVCHRSGYANSAARTTVEVAQATQEVERQGHSGEKSERRGDMLMAHRLER